MTNAACFHGQPPCIMCVQYRGGAQYVPWGDIMSTVGDILSTVGVFSTVGDIMINVGDIMSTVGCSVLLGIPSLKFECRGGYHDTCAGFHEYRGGCSVP